MWRASASLLQASTRKMNLVLEVSNLDSRGFGKLGDGNERRDHKRLPRSLPGFSVLCFMLVIAVLLLYPPTWPPLLHHHREPSPLFAPSPHLQHALSNHLDEPSLIFHARTHHITLHPNINQPPLSRHPNPCVNTLSTNRFAVSIPASFTPRHWQCIQSLDHPIPSRSTPFPPFSSCLFLPSVPRIRIHRRWQRITHDPSSQTHKLSCPTHAHARARHSKLSRLMLL